MYSVPEVNTKYMDASICAIYDGKKYYIGFSPSFEYPKKVVDRVLNGEELGYMEDIFGNTAKGRKGAIGVLTAGRVNRVLQGEELGYMEDIFGNTAKGRKGAIGVLTAGRVYRDELEEYAVIMALTKIVSKEIYDKK